MKIWLTTDTHFGHKKLIEWGRPEDFEYQIWTGLLSCRPGEVLIHLGDVCIGHDEDAHRINIQPLQCLKVLVRGNHDHKSNSWYFDHGWDLVVDSFTTTLYGKRIEFSHKPLPKREGIDMNIHGHWHGNDHRQDECPFYDDSYHRQIALEWTNYKPVELTEKFICGNIKNN
jgi:calcineurin-like phosphoesterase family protein